MSGVNLLYRQQRPLKKWISGCLPKGSMTGWHGMVRIKTDFFVRVAWARGDLDVRHLAR